MFFVSFRVLLCVLNFLADDYPLGDVLFLIIFTPVAPLLDDMLTSFKGLNHTKIQ